jgi:hypothetical protein
MVKKLTAAQVLAGRFSTEGLVALAGEDANVEIALAPCSSTGWTKATPAGCGTGWGIPGSKATTKAFLSSRTRNPRTPLQPTSCHGSEPPSGNRTHGQTASSRGHQAGFPHSPATAPGHSPPVKGGSSNEAPLPPWTGSQPDLRGAGGRFWMTGRVRTTARFAIQPQQGFQSYFERTSVSGGKSPATTSERDSASTSTAKSPSRQMPPRPS